MATTYDQYSANEIQKGAPSPRFFHPAERSKRPQSSFVPKSSDNPKSPRSSDTKSGTAPHQGTNLSHVPCKFFKQRICTAGTNCIFSHNLDPSIGPAVCKYFIKGNCKFGTRCALLHTMSSYTPKNRKFAFKGAVTILSAKITAGNQLPNHHINQYDVCQPLVSSSIYSDNLSISADEYFNRFHHLASMLPHKQDAPFPFVASYPQPSFANVYQQRAYSSKYAQRCIVTDLSKDMLPSRPVLCESSDDSAGSLPSSTTPAPFGFSSSLTSSHAPPSPAAHMISCSDRSSDLVPDVCLSKYRKLPPYYTPTSYPDDCYDDNNEGFNDAILPSSLNDLLTASELELRERQAHCQQQRQLMRGHSTQRSCQSHSPQESEASFFYPMNNNHTILVQMATDEGN